jgi:hypothetical protein
MIVSQNTTTTAAAARRECLASLKAGAEGRGFYHKDGRSYPRVALD